MHIRRTDSHDKGFFPDEGWLMLKSPGRRPNGETKRAGSQRSKPVQRRIGVLEA